MCHSINNMLIIDMSVMLSCHIHTGTVGIANVIICQYSVMRCEQRACDCGVLLCVMCCSGRGLSIVAMCQSIHSHIGHRSVHRYASIQSVTYENLK